MALESQVESLDGHFKKQAIVGVTCWELKSQLFKALVLPTFKYATEN